VQSEDYETAAKLRDKIKKYETGKNEADRSK
jgi:protein-arginine kinase activator protein McsA